DRGHAEQWQAVRGHRRRRSDGSWRAHCVGGEARRRAPLTPIPFLRVGPFLPRGSVPTARVRSLRAGPFLPRGSNSARAGGVHPRSVSYRVLPRLATVTVGLVRGLSRYLSCYAF